MLEQDDTILKAITQQIEYHKKKLEHLNKVKQFYLEENKNKLVTDQAHSEHSYRDEKLTGISSQMIDTLLTYWPMEKTFSADELFGELAKKYDLSSLRKRNASAQICTILGRRIKQGILEKYERGIYKKKNNTIDYSKSNKLLEDN